MLKAKKKEGTNALVATSFTPSPSLASVRQHPTPSLPAHPSPHRQVCYEREIDTVILTCCHRVVCVRCSALVKCCPVCRCVYAWMDRARV